MLEAAYLQQDFVRILLRLSYSFPEGCQGVLADDSSVCEPFSVGLNNGCRHILALVRRGLGDDTICVALSLALFEDVELLHSFGRPVEVLALGADVGHAIGACALASPKVRLLYIEMLVSISNCRKVQVTISRTFFLVPILLVFV